MDKKSDFQIMMEEGAPFGNSWSEMIREFDQNNPLDVKTRELIYITNLVTLRLQDGLAFHIKKFKEAGGTLEELKAAVLMVLPVAGKIVTESFPLVISIYKEED